jgi:hypothetical protein
MVRIHFFSLFTPAISSLVFEINPSSLIFSP